LERDVLNEGEVGIKGREALRGGSVCFRTLASVLETFLHYYKLILPLSTCKLCTSCEASVDPFQNMKCNYTSMKEI
jgi:hypothetical protein